MSVTPTANQTRVFAGTGITPKAPDQTRQDFTMIAPADPHPVPEIIKGIEFRDSIRQFQNAA